MAGFGLWMYFFLIRLRGYHRKIKTFRDGGEYEKEREQIRNSTAEWGLGIMKKARVDLQITGLENVPEGPALFVSNHQGYADIPVLCAALKERAVGFVAKTSLSKIPMFGQWIRDIRSVFLEREDARSSLKTMDEAAEFLKLGFSLVIFPEGTRSKGSVPGEFRKGSLRPALKSGVPVVPVTLNGTYRIFEESGYVKPGMRVTVHFHPHEETQGLSKAAAGELAEKVESTIRGAL